MNQLEGNGNPLQYSCLENPMDAGAWWAAIYGVAQSQTRLKDLAAAAAYIYPLPLGLHSQSSPTPPLSVITEHQAGLFLFYSSFPLAGYFTHGCVICQSYSHNSSHSPAPTPCHSHLSILYIWISFPALEIGPSGTIVES